MPLDLFPYQTQGAEFLSKRSRAGIFDTMGLGKSAQAIRALDLRRARRGIIICPAAVRAVWQGEFAKFQRQGRTVCKAQSIHDYIAWQRGVFDVLLCSYEQATKWQKHINNACEPLDFIVLDEFHYCKSADTARSQHILGENSDGKGGLIQWASCVYMLTGTPLPNSPKDIFTFLKAVGALGGLDEADFCRRFFNSHSRTYSTAHDPKREMLPELQALIANNSIRRTLDEAGIELPPIFVTTTFVDGDTQAVRDLLLQHPGMDKAILAALQNGGGLSKIDADHVATLRRLIGEAKAIPYAALLLEELRGGLDKVCVFGIHRLALQGCQRYLERHGVGTVLVNGDTSEKDRVTFMAAFQQDPKCRVFIGNIRAAGVGLTLTSAAAIDMLESDWTPAGNAQAIKRVHRISQTRSVRARFITLAGSFDEVVNQIVADKSAKIAMIEGETV